MSETRPFEEAINTDKEIWRKINNDYYSPSIHVTNDGSIGINVGGRVEVHSIETWHRVLEAAGKVDKTEREFFLDLVSDPDWYEDRGRTIRSLLESLPDKEKT